MSPGLFYLCHDYCCGTGEICFQLKSLMVSLCFRVPFASGSRLLQGPVCFRVLFASGSCLLQGPVCFRILLAQVSGTCCDSCTGYRKGFNYSGCVFQNR